MTSMIDAIASRLSSSDAALLKSVYEPRIVAVPPADACKHLCVTPDGEIRIYGAAGRVQPDDEGVRAYIFSTDGGLSWKTVTDVEPSALGAAAYAPETGRYITYFPQENRRTYPENYPDRTSGSWIMFNDEGYDAPASRFVKLCDETVHFQKQPYYLKKWKRWLLPSECRRENKEKFIVVSYSDDNGETWTTVELPHHAPIFVPTPPHKGSRWQDYSCEPTVAELGDGTLLMLERTSQDFHYQRFSYDGGVTWTEPEPSIFHGTLTMPVLHRLSDGRLLHFWCGTQPLPELDHEAQWPPLSADERTGVWEDVFTNRDANHMAVSEDDGKTWAGLREFFLNGLRNRADYRSVGGADSRDKSVHQGEMIELPFGKVLISFGQNAASRKVMLFDPNWLYEKSRAEDFRLGLDNVTTHMYLKSNSGGYRGFSGHCSWNRTNGALLVPDPDGNFEEALQICRVRDERLVYEKQGVVWNFPAAVRGEVSVRLRVEGSGVQLCLLDHWYNACDESVGSAAPLRFDTVSLPLGCWIDLVVRYDAASGHADVWADGQNVASLPVKPCAPYGLCYLHIQTLAESEDFSGTIVKRMSMRAL